MEKTIKIGSENVRLTNNISWAIVYRDQFGHDIIPTFTPMLAAFMDIVSGLLNNTENPEQVTLNDVLKALDGDVIIEAVAHLSALEFVELINMTWAMAKACDDDIPEPMEWVKGFETFPVDQIAPEVLKLAFKGMVSSKNLKRLQDLFERLRTKQPLTSTPSSSPESNED